MTEKDSREKTAETTPFQRFQQLIRGLASVPKKEIEAEEARWRVNRAMKKKHAND
jgi:hypothetical protein